MTDAESLRAEFSQPEIEDDWEILAEGDGGGAYGYGSRDLLMYLRRDGKLYCQEASCCSCNGIDGAFDPVETNVETIERDLLGYEGKGQGGTWKDDDKAAVCREALEKLRASESEGQSR